jgi:universal stress protein A
MAFHASIYKPFTFGEPRKKGTVMTAKTEPKQKAGVLKIRNILVPVDFSENASEALKSASELATQMGARITLIHVIEPPPLMSGYEALPYKVSDKQLAMTAQTELEALAVRFVNPAVETKGVLRKGKPHHEIVKAARELNADLLVISTHGYTGLKHTLLGSTAERVVRHARCPVLVLPNAR